jgi:hypothetical protein
MDGSPGTIYFSSPGDWAGLPEAQGFVVNRHIDSPYPENGHDTLLVARRRT